MKYKKVILFIILLEASFWVFRYFTGYIHHFHKSLFFILLLTVFPTLPLIGIFQVLKFTIEREKHHERLVYATSIFILTALIILIPQGPVNWESLERKPILHAQSSRFGQLKLNANQSCKYVFDRDFYFGKYEIRQDTIHLKLRRDTPWMYTSSYAVLGKSQKDTTTFDRICLHPNYQTKKGMCWRLGIQSVDMHQLSLVSK